ncbi:MAG TPA: acyl-CoA ligase (AMP-forming), exosortase A system-associated [Streptosporangiaceae bacterium]
MRTQIHHLLAEAADARRNAPALTYNGNTVTYAQLWRDVEGFGAALRELGLRRGDRVAVYLEKRIETVTALFGTSAGYGVFVPVNPLLRPKQVAYIMRDCNVRVLVTSPERLTLLREELVECKSVEHVVLVGHEAAIPPAKSGERYMVSPWPTSVDSVSEIAGGIIDADMAAILYTSGSTGRPKGVVLSQRNLIVAAESVSHYLGNSPDDVILSALPLSFDAGFSQLTTAFSVGAHVVLMNYLLPAEVIRLCAQHHVTGLTGVPPLWFQIADQDWPAEATRYLRYFANTGGRMPRATLDRLRSVFPRATPFLMYGLTEAFRSTYLDPAEVDRRPDSIGKAIPNAEILVVRPDGSLCDPGEEGELVHRGALVAMGYWNDPERTAERFRPAPVREAGLCTEELAVWSGDVVVSDEEGFLYFVSRKDEMIKTSGYRVSPSEIEEVAYDTGLVRDAVAIGVEDAKFGQHIVLVVSPASGAQVDVDMLLSQMKKGLPLYMLPARVDVRPEIPRSPNGKFDRTLLRKELTA